MNNRSAYLWFFFIFFVFTTIKLNGQTILTLESSLEIARKNSPNIKKLELNVERSRQLLNAQNAALKSQFSLSITPFDYSQDRSFNNFFSTWYTNEIKQSYSTFTISQPIKYTDGTLALINQFTWRDAYSEYQNLRSKTFSNNLYLSYNQPIFTYNRTKMTLRELELDLENTSLNYAIQMLNLERLVAQSFFTVYQARMSLEIAKEELKNYEKNYEITQNKVNAGLAPLEELYQAELNVASSKSQVQNSEVSLENAKDNLKKLIGISLFEQIDVVADVNYQPIKIDLQKAIDHGLKYRMELRQQKIDIENAYFNLIRTSAINEFKGTVNLSYGIIGTDEKFQDIYNVPTKNQRVALSFNIPLFDWGEKRSRIKASEATIEVSKLDLDDEKKNIIIAIRNVYRNLKNLETQIELARKNVENAQRTYDINLERYNNGDLTGMDLQLYQTQLSQKKQSLINSLISYKLELLNMKIQSLYDFEKDESVVPSIIK